MPYGDGTGPSGKGPRTGRGRGMGNRGAGFKGRMGGGSMGPSGECICPSCGQRVNHERGVPCNAIECPRCGASMARN